MRRRAEDRREQVGGGRSQHHAGAGVSQDRFRERVEAVRVFGVLGVLGASGVFGVFGHHHGDVRRAAVPQRHLQQRQRVLVPAGRGQVTEGDGPVEEDPQGASDVVRRGLPGLPGAVRGDQPALRLVGRPPQARHRARQRALDRQHAVAPRQTGVLAGAAALDDQHVTVLERLEGEGPQQGRGAAAGLADGQQVRLRGARAGAPHHRGFVAPLLAVVEGNGALDAGGIGETEHEFARRGHEALGGDVGGERGQHAQRQLVALLVPREVVFAPPAGLGLQHLLDAGARLGLAVGEVRRVADGQPGDPARLVELVSGQGRRPVAPVPEEGEGSPAAVK